MNPRPVAGLAVGIDRAAVPDRAQRLDCRLDDAARWLAVGRRDQPDAAGIGFEVGPVHARFGEPRVIGGGEMRHVFVPDRSRSEEHTSELQSLMRISYAVFCLI